MLIDTYTSIQFTFAIYPLSLSLCLLPFTLESRKRRQKSTPLYTQRVGSITSSYLRALTPVLCCVVCAARTPFVKPAPRLARRSPTRRRQRRLALTPAFITPGPSVPETPDRDMLLPYATSNRASHKGKSQSGSDLAPRHGVGLKR